jgi:hypothetical protein
MSVTVKYPDEGPVTYASEEDRRLFEEIKAVCGGTVREVCAMARAFIRVEMDPIHASGEPFVFPKGSGEPDFCWFSPEVPGPYANVDILEAMDVSERDAKACSLTLEVDQSIEATLRIYKNSISWLRFWSIRSPSAEGRVTAARNLERMEQGLSQLRAKAFMKANREMIEGLADV